MADKHALEDEFDDCRRELALTRAREKHYRRIFEAMLEGFGLGEIILDEHGVPCDFRLLEVNEAFGRLTPFSPAQANGRTARELVPDVEAHWIEAFGKVALSGEPARFENYVAALDKWFEVFSYQTAPGRFAFLFTDISVRKSAELALRDREERYRRQVAELELVYRTAPVGLCVVDTELRYVQINERLAELNGLPAHAHIGRTVREILPGVADRAEPLLRKVLTTGKPVLGIEASAELQPGVQRHWLSQYWPLIAEDGEVFGVNAVVEEVTERKWLEDSREREREFRTLAENSTDVVARFDRSLRRIYVNRAIEEILGRPREEILGKTHRELGLPEAMAESLNRTLAEVFATGEPRTAEPTVETPHGTRYFDSRFVPEVDADGNVVTVLAISREITGRKRAEQALHRREREFAALVEHASDIVARVDRSLRLRYVNPEIERLTGRPRQRFLGKPLPRQGLSRAEVAKREQALRQVFASGRESSLEHKNPSVRGERYYQARLVPELGADGRVESVLIVDRDIHDLKSTQLALEALTLVDPLTGVANRRHLERFVEREWRREARHGQPVAVIMLDIDHFKAYNDRYGHAQGDQCLRQVAETLRSELHRPADTLVRCGGEEFMAILPESDLDAAREIAERLRQAVEHLKLPHGAAPSTDYVTISLGVAAAQARTSEFHDLMAAADAALYRAKGEGRNRVETASP